MTDSLKTGETGFEAWLGQMRSRVRKLEGRIGANFASVGTWQMYVSADGDLIVSGPDGPANILAAGSTTAEAMYPSIEVWNTHIDTEDDDLVPHAQHPHRSEIGAADGVAPLGSDGAVPRANLVSTAAEPDSIWALLKQRRPELHAQTRPASLTVVEREAITSLHWPSQPAAAYWTDADTGTTYIFAVTDDGTIFRTTADPVGLEPDDIGDLSAVIIVDQPNDTVVRSISQPLDISELGILGYDAVSVIQVESTTDIGYGWHELAVSSDECLTWTFLGAIYEPQLDSGDVADSLLGNALPGVGQLNTTTIDDTVYIFSTCIDVDADGVPTNLSLYGAEWADFLDDLTSETLPTFFKWGGTGFSEDASTGLAVDLAPITVGTYHDNIARLGMGQNSDLAWVSAINRWILLWANTIEGVSQLYATVSRGTTPLQWADPSPLLEEPADVPTEFVFPWLYSGDPTAPKEINYDGITLNYLTVGADRWGTAVWNTGRVKPALQATTGIELFRVNAVGSTASTPTGVGQVLTVPRSNGTTFLRSVVPGDQVLVTRVLDISAEAGIYTVPASGGDWIFNDEQPTVDDVVQDSFDSYNYGTFGTLWQKYEFGGTSTWGPVNLLFLGEIIDRFVRSWEQPWVAGQSTLATGRPDPDPTTMPTETVTDGILYGYVLNLPHAITFDAVNVWTSGAVAATASIAIYANRNGRPTKTPLYEFTDIDIGAAGWITEAAGSDITLPAGIYHAVFITDTARDMRSHSHDTAAFPSVDIGTGDIQIGWTFPSDMFPDLTYDVDALAGTYTTINDGDPMPAIWFTTSTPIT